MNTQNDRSPIQDLYRAMELLRAMQSEIANLLRNVQNALPAQPSAVVLAKHHYKDRRSREYLLGADDIFGEPAWDMLVDLFIAAEEGKRISVSSLCLASNVPDTTALRWIAILESKGFIERSQDPEDRRRYYLNLADEPYIKLKQFFEKPLPLAADAGQSLGL